MAGDIHRISASRSRSKHRVNGQRGGARRCGVTKRQRRVALAASISMPYQQQQ